MPKHTLPWYFPSFGSVCTCHSPVYGSTIRYTGTPAAA